MIDKVIKNLIQFFSERPARPSSRAATSPEPLLEVKNENLKKNFDYNFKKN